MLRYFSILHFDENLFEIAIVEIGIETYEKGVHSQVECDLRQLIHKSDGEKNYHHECGYVMAQKCPIPRNIEESGA